MIDVAAKKTTEPNEAVPEGAPTGIASLGNPYDLPWPAGKRPEHADVTVPPPAEVGHLGVMSDPTPREEYTVAGQIAKQQQASKEADK